MNAVLVDAGNTRIKWARATGGRLAGPGEAIARARSPREDAAALARAWSAGYEPPHRVLVACIADAGLVAALSEWTLATWAVPVETVTASREAFGVRNGYTRSERLGVDRWLGLIAARRIVPGAPCAVIDCGTAITVDALRGDGCHAGGLILPGLAMMRAALVAGTRGVRIDEPPDAAAIEGLAPYAADTAAAVRGGTLWAAVGAIDRLVDTLRAELGESLACIITGGDAPVVAPLLAAACRHEPDLVLAGLAIVSGERDA